MWEVESSEWSAKPPDMGVAQKSVRKIAPIGRGLLPKRDINNNDVNDQVRMIAPIGRGLPPEYIASCVFGHRIVRMIAPIGRGSQSDDTHATTARPYTKTPKQKRPPNHSKVGRSRVVWPVALGRLYCEIYVGFPIFPPAFLPWAILYPTLHKGGDAAHVDRAGAGQVGVTTLSYFILYQYSWS